MSTHIIPFFNIKKKITLIYPKSVAMGFFSKGFKNEFERAVVNEPSVFEPLKFYFTTMWDEGRLRRVKLLLCLGMNEILLTGKP